MDVALLERLLGRDEPAPEPPASPKERRRLEHEERKLKRRIKRLEKELDKTHCSTCAKAPIDDQRLAMSRALKDAKADLEHVRARLDAGEAS